MEWAPTENPNSTIVPGKMRSDRQELPEGFTKEDADRAEIAEAKLLAASRSRTARSAGATNVLAAAAPTDCMIYFPAWQYQVCGQIRVKYDSLGGPNSFLHFMMKWGQHGWEAGWLGYPTSDEIVLQNGRRQEFQSGAAIYWSPVSLGIVGGAIRDRYNALNAETGPLGYPSSDETWVTKYNGRYNNFLNGTITWSGQTGARVLYTAIRDRWAALGREDGSLGFPLADEQITPDGVGRYARFENGVPIYWTPLTGAWDLSQLTLPVWAATNYESGVLGYPTGPPTSTSEMVDSQKFQNGALATYQDGTASVFHY